MNPRIPTLIAALLAAGVASAQAPKPAPDAAAPTPVSALKLSEQPMFSITTGTQSPNAQAANAIAQALAADTSLKGAKITVQPEQNGILLTGVTSTLAQMNRAVQIANQHAGGGPVVSAISTEEVFIAPNPTGPTGNEQFEAPAAQG
jgi:hypothetical protein